MSKLKYLKRKKINTANKYAPNWRSVVQSLGAIKKNSSGRYVIDDFKGQREGEVFPGSYLEMNGTSHDVRNTIDPSLIKKITLIGVFKREDGDPTNRQIYGADGTATGYLLNTVNGGQTSLNAGSPVYSLTDAEMFDGTIRTLTISDFDISSWNTFGLRWDGTFAPFCNLHSMTIYGTGDVILANYNFEEETGQTVFDNSGSNNHGTISGDYEFIRKPSLDIKSDKNNFGYTDNAGQHIPADQSDLTNDVLGNPLQHVGQVKYNVETSNSVLNFNGSDNYVNLGNQPEFQLTDNFSIEVAVGSVPSSGWNNEVFIGKASNASVGFNFRMLGGKLSLVYSNNGSGFIIIQSTFTNVLVGDKVKMAVTNGELEFFVNGVSVFTSTIGAIYNSTADMFIGFWLNGASADLYRGVMQCVLIENNGVEVFSTNFIETSGDQVYNEVDGQPHQIVGEYTDAWQHSKDQVPYALLNGFDLYENGLRTPIGANTELITNGDFDTDSDWNLTDQSLTIGNGTINFSASGNGQGARQLATLTAGDQVQYEIKINSVQSGRITVVFNGLVVDEFFTSNGVYTGVAVVGTGTPFIDIKSAQTGTTAIVDSISVKPALKYTQQGTRVGFTDCGSLRYQPTANDLLLVNNQFDKKLWYTDYYCNSMDDGFLDIGEWLIPPSTIISDSTLYFDYDSYLDMGHCNFNPVVGITYKISVEQVEYSNETCRFVFGGHVLSLGFELKTYEFEVTATSTQQLLIVGTGFGYTGAIKNITISDVVLEPQPITYDDIQPNYESKNLWMNDIFKKAPVQRKWTVFDTPISDTGGLGGGPSLLERTELFMGSITPYQVLGGDYETLDGPYYVNIEGE